MYERYDPKVYVTTCVMMNDMYISHILDVCEDY